MAKRIEAADGRSLRIQLLARDPFYMLEDALGWIDLEQGRGWAFVELELKRDPRRGNRGRGELRFISEAARSEAAAARSARKRERREVSG